MKLVFLGPPGSGKGTVAKLISKELSCYHLSTGDLFRENISNSTELGLQVKQLVESGKFVPDAITIDVVEQKLKCIDLNKGLILDGFPRNVLQAEALDYILLNVKIINFTIDDITLIKRLSGRRVCKSCGGIFNICTLPPRTEGICDHCGSNSLFQRKDDQEGSVKIRLEEHNIQTKPLIEYYAKTNRLNNIDASIVLADLLKKLILIIKEAN